MRNPALAALTLLLCACKSTPAKQPGPASGQTFPQAVTMICDVDRLAGLKAEDDPLGVGGQRTAWLGEKVENPDGIELKTMLSVKGAADQARMLRDAAKEVGLQRCALAESLDQQQAGGISP